MTELLVPVAFFVAALSGLVIRFGFTRERRIKRTLKAVKPTAIASALDGRAVKIVGEVAYAGRSIASPLSGRLCAFYSIVVEEYRSSGKSGAWHEILRDEKGVDFLVRDDSGMALVRIASDGAALPALVQDRKARTSPILHSDFDLERYLGERGISVEGRFFRKNLRAAEGILEEGERVAVGGLARWLPDPNAGGGGYREAGKRLVLQSSEALPLFLSDDPKTL
ncbi:MAG: hypothetical protein JWN44_1451 [Myxococcales bacterium]|nr:hypothetical protein [Myxococcales bacterium]